MERNYEFYLKMCWLLWRGLLLLFKAIILRKMRKNHIYIEGGNIFNDHIS